MATVFAILAAVLAFRCSALRLTAEAAIYWIVEHHPDFTAEDLQPAREAILSKKYDKF